MMRLASLAFNTPLMIDERKAATIASVFGPRLLGADVTVIGVEGVDHSVHRMKAGIVGEGIRLALEKRELLGFPRIDNVGIIAVEGTLVQKGAFLGQSSGETSYEGLMAQVARAKADAGVKAVVFEVDTFGGMVNGAFELAARIRELSAVKPTLAILTDFALSAGYLIASQARQIVMPKFGAAGSIGTIVMHVDRSKALENEGLTVTVVKSGAYKSEGSIPGPPSDEMLQRMQSRVDQARDDFAAAVAKGRGERLTKAAALATEARVYEGEAAVEAGLVDAIGDPHQAFDAFRKAVNRG